MGSPTGRHATGSAQRGCSRLTGRVILLNGCSSAGKTTLAHAIQWQNPEPMQYMALDQFRDGMPSRYRGMNSQGGEPGARGLNVVPRGGLTHLHFGDIGEAVLRGMRRAVAAFATSGIDVVVDDLILERTFLIDYLEALDGLDVTFVGVRCDLATVNARERTRPGRFPGTAAAHFEAVHQHCVYDLEVDTSRERPETCARQALQAAYGGTSDHGAFAVLRGRFSLELQV